MLPEPATTPSMATEAKRPGKLLTPNKVALNFLISTLKFGRIAKSENKTSPSLRFTVRISKLNEDFDLALSRVCSGTSALGLENSLRKFDNPSSLISKRSVG